MSEVKKLSEAAHELDPTNNLGSTLSGLLGKLDPWVEVDGGVITGAEQPTEEEVDPDDWLPDEEDFRLDQAS